MVRYADPGLAGAAAAPGERGQPEPPGVDAQPPRPPVGVHEVVDPAVVRRVAGVRVAPVAVRVEDRVQARAGATRRGEPLGARVCHGGGEDVVGHAGEGGGGEGVDVAAEDLEVGVGGGDGGDRLEGLGVNSIDIMNFGHKTGH